MIIILFVRGDDWSETTHVRDSKNLRALANLNYCLLSTKMMKLLEFNNDEIGPTLKQFFFLLKSKRIRVFIQGNSPSSAQDPMFDEHV